MLKRDKGTNLFATNNTLRIFFHLFMRGKRPGLRRMSVGRAAATTDTAIRRPGSRPKRARVRATCPPEVGAGIRIGCKIPHRIANYELFSYLCAPKRSSDRSRAHSSVGQSSGLIIRRSWDHAPLGPPVNPAANSFAAGFLFSAGGRGFSRFFRIFAGKQTIRDYGIRR